MSSHRLSVSGDRQANLTIGGGPFSAVQYPSKPGDLAVAQLNPGGGEGRVEIALPLHITSSGGREPAIRIEKRRYKSTHQAGHDIAYVLVVDAGIGITAIVEGVGEHGYPHTNVDVRRLDADRRNHPIDLGRQHDVLEITPLEGDVSYEPADHELTETNLVNKLMEDGIEASGRHRPVVLAVSDRRTELVARRILHSTDPETGEPQVAGGLAKLKGLPIVIDDDMDVSGQWELRYAGETGEAGGMGPVVEGGEFPDLSR